ncbi:MAG: hypothetical protein PHT69_07705 [Bacteroidales bacterium]|nr:hypothetical protein [Bacteroidales bacterium]
MNNHIQRSSVQKTICLILCILYFLFYVFHVNLTNRIDVHYGSDEWDYQTIAVNFAKGHGFHISGNYENPETYKFGHIDKNVFDKQELLKGIPNIHRPPLYPLLIGIIYKISGINPVVIVLLQLFLLCLLASLLPFISLRFFGKNGFWIGILSGFLFMIYAHKMANIFLPGQVVTLFLVTMYVYVFQGFLKTRSFKYLILASTLLSVSLLFHASMILVLGFMGTFLFIGIVKERDLKALYQLLAFVIINLLILLPWHLYAFGVLADLKKESVIVLNTITDISLDKEKKAEIISTGAPRYGMILMPKKEFSESEIGIIQDSVLRDAAYFGLNVETINESNIDFHKISLMQELIDAPSVFLIFLSPAKNMALDAHNEYVTDGWASKLWRYNAQSYYRNDGKEGQISFLRVFGFYKEHPKFLYLLAGSKIETAFRDNIYIKLFFLFFVLSFLFQKLNEMKWPLIYKRISGIISILFVIAFSFIPEINCFLLIAYGFALLLVFFSKQKDLPPLSFNWVFFNLVIFTVLAYGNSRYFDVLASLFALLSVHSFFCSLYYFKSFWRGDLKCDYHKEFLKE